VPFRIFQRRPAPAAPAAPAAARSAAAPSAAAGCLVCGAALADAGGAPGACALCGREGRLAERCAAGHAACAACLAGPAAEVIARACGATEERDPVAIAVRLTRHPTLRLGPADHDLLVAAALVASWSTVRGEGAQRAARVRAAVERAPRAAPPARPDGRGAATAAGTFVALAAEADRRASVEALVEQAAARARALVGEGEDALCLRRNALVSILATARFARDHLGADLPARGLACERAGKNPSCVGAGCPFHR
jgi:hypothetical protein